MRWWGCPPAVLPASSAALLALASVVEVVVVYGIMKELEDLAIIMAAMVAHHMVCLELIVNIAVGEVAVLEMLIQVQ